MKPVTPEARKMTSVERRMAEQLFLAKSEGKIIDYYICDQVGIKFKIADKTYYTPDFMVVLEDRFELIETKGGHIWNTSIVKFKTCKQIFPYFIWKMMQWTKKNGWVQIH